MSEKVVEAFKKSIINIQSEGNSFVVSLSVNKLFNNLSDDIEVVKSGIDNGKIVVYGTLKDLKTMNADIIESAVAKVVLKPNVIDYFKQVSGLEVGTPTQVGDDVIINIKIPMKNKVEF